MTFQEGGSFEGGRVRTGRGGKIAAGGGGLAALVVALIYVFSNGQVDLSGVAGGGSGADTTEGTIGDCTAEQANTDPSCRLSATIQSLDAYWGPTVTAAGVTFAQPEVYSFEGAADTACGSASSSTGPFYCPPDATIYLDLGFFDELQSRFGAEGGPLAEEYVEAHEYGHHVQQLTGVMDQAQRGGTGADSDSVRVELQADCYAGMWAGRAATTVDPDTGVPFLDPITADTLEQALSAAQAVGDDHIQAQSGGGINPDTWTHGSSEQRARWFTTGYEQGTFDACDTFSTDTL
ncbi:membrane protein [Cellulomonas chitinilytica]|uniref:Membrane protein n=1 Tax=Cellulomonas chitinilytica TaxID=398759 RepID=A0A919U110_9CELL|nr:neutral zinc metallopeptidase [Cellulomonas chitinilytica]GIG20946.1 membrane protein [Cellulomonas chitinilytica]